MPVYSPFESMLQDFWLDSQEKLQRVEAILLEYAKADAGRQNSLLKELQLLLHTLKGNSAMMGFEDLREQVHHIENPLKSADPGSVDVHGLLESIDAFTAQLRAKCQLDSDEESAEQEREEDVATTTLQDGVRIPFSSLDKLVDLVSELILSRNQLADSISSGTRANAEESGRGDRSKWSWRQVKLAFDSLCSTLDEAQRSILQLRMVPLGSIFGPLNRIVFDESSAASKSVELETSGGETPLDKALLEVASEALGHLVRNAVVHGIESPEERAEMGKPREAKIRLVASQGADEIIIEISDDGRGIDEDRLREVAAERGIDVSTLDDIYSVLFVSGFTTKEEADLSSGRGVGLSAVREAVRLQGGRVEILSKLGEGTTFRLTLPLNVSIAPALLLESDGEHYALPLDAVVDSQRHEASRSNRVNHAMVTEWRSTTIPFVDIGLQLGTRTEVSDHGYIVIIESHGRTRGLLVDKIHGIQDFVVKGLDPIVGEPEGISGCTLLGDGSAILFLDPVAWTNLAPFAEAAS